MDMNQAMSVLEQYDIEVRGVRKGRGCLIVNCKEGDFVLKEYAGSERKAALQKVLTNRISERTNIIVQEILLNKEGNLIVKDSEEKKYTLQTYMEGRECNIKDAKECELAVRMMATIHKEMILDRETALNISFYSLQHEFSKRNTELRRVRRYLKEKRQKNDFEHFLYNNYNYFFQRALDVEEEWKSYESLCNMDSQQIVFCHGDFQHHNIWFTHQEAMILQFEKYTADYPCRDLYLFSRKLLEKNNWSIESGKAIFDIYESVREIPAVEKISMVYRFAYPEKFWKIVNYYFNSKKSFMPEKNMEKMEKLLEQQKVKDFFVDEVLKKLDK